MRYTDCQQKKRARVFAMQFERW